MDYYLTALLQGLCLSSMALGIYISMKIFNIPDITTDGSYTLGAVVTARLLVFRMPLFEVLPLVIAAGAIAGTVTGLIHTKLRINALLAGILVMTALYSINLEVMGRSNIPLVNTASLFSLVRIAPDMNENALFTLLLLLAAIGAIIAYLLKTDFGIAMRATGSSESMVRALGVSTDRMKIIGLALANALTAVSGFLMTQLQGYADINMGIGIVIVGLGSVIIAETFINWLHLRAVWGSIVLVFGGAIIFQFVLSLTLSLGIDATLLKLVTAVFVLLIVSLPRLSFSRR